MSCEIVYDGNHPFVKSSYKLEKRLLSYIQQYEHLYDYIDFISCPNPKGTMLCSYCDSDGEGWHNHYPSARNKFWMQFKLHSEDGPHYLHMYYVKYADNDSENLSSDEWMELESYLKNKIDLFYTGKLIPKSGMGYIDLVK